LRNIFGLPYAHIIEEGSGRKFVGRLMNDGGNEKERESIDLP